MTTEADMWGYRYPTRFTRDRPNDLAEAGMRQNRWFHAVMFWNRAEGEGLPQDWCCRLQRGPCILVTRRDVIEHDNVVGSSGITESRFHRDGRFDQLHAGPDVLDQGYEFRNDRTISVVSIVGSGRNAAASCALHECSP